MTEAGLARRDLLGASAGVVASGVLAPPALLAQADSPSLPDRAGRLADVALFARAYETLHPGLHRYLTPGQWRAVRDRLEREAVAAEHHGQFWLAFNRATSAVRCGHSYVSPFNMGKLWTGVMEARADRLPFHFRWIDRQMIVTKPLVVHPALVRGTRVSTIDGEADGSLLARMLPQARADGGNDFKRIANMEVREGASQWEAFDVMWALARSPAPRSAKLLLEPPGADAVLADLPLLGRESRGTGTKDERRGWVHRHEGDATLLTMPDWTTYNTKWDWRSWLTGVIDETIARGSKRLVVDLRGNEGGEDCGDPILARMIGAPLSEAGAVRRVRFRETPPDMRPHLDTWDPSFHTLGKDASGPDADGLYTLPSRPSDALAPANGPRLTTKLIVLIDSANSSATFQFAQKVRRNGLGVLLGEPTGGNQRGINGGAYFFLRLPQSRLETDLPLIGYFPPGNLPDAGLMPDVAVPTTRRSIARGEDPQMARALQLPLA